MKVPSGLLAVIQDSGTETEARSCRVGRARNKSKEKQEVVVESETGWRAQLACSRSGVAV